MHLNLTLVDWIVCLAALAFNIMFGLYLGLRARKKGDSSSFFLAGRTLSWPVVGASLFATNIGAEHMVGLSGDSYRYGICAGTVELTTVISLGIAAAVLMPVLHKKQGLYHPRVSRTPLPLRGADVLLRLYGLHLRRDQDGFYPVCRGAGHAGGHGLGDHAERADHGGDDRHHHDDRRLRRRRLHRRHPHAHHDCRFGDNPLYGPPQGRRVGRALRGGAAFAGAQRHAHAQGVDRSHLSVLGRHSGCRLRRDFLLGDGPGQRPADARRPGPEAGALGRDVRRCS